MFHVGQKVECVDDGEHPELNSWIGGVTDSLDGLTKGTKYTIRWIGSRLAYTNTGIEHMLHVRLAEIHRGNEKDGEEAAYFAMRFRPLVKRETDISVFEKLIGPNPKIAKKREKEVALEILAIGEVDADI